MPTYEYLCTSCKNQWEEVQKISEPAVKVCPKCSKRTAQRQISAGNFILKGGGWYSDSYSSPKPPAKKGEASGESSASKDDSAGSAKAEAKSAVTSDGKAESKADGKAKESAPPPKKTESSPPKAASGSSGDGKSS